MFSIRIISLAALLLGSVAVNAAVTAHHVQPGNLYVAKPAHFSPQHEGDTGPSGHRNHPVVALSHPDAHGWVPVAAVSHNHPAHMGPTENAQRFDHDTHHGGHGGFESGSRIATARLVHVHVDDLHHVNADSGLPTHLRGDDTHNLRAAVRAASGQSFDNPRHRTPTPPWRSGH
ncbi:hypothetical protein HYPSUDRAFT_220034 [Hypholoma sublateritium FD-334 SS-4]|uniref:Uncharacterized protein n=1 Tax=Hypholoma sublateritium (strain FD-334 SS-4) TaxID=945553 RepID=A0A0D2KLH5_HYPSF|nr:hypothetical protein HYPSUDRAFT_220034 [Hypholoma sublateritium FD-334 SS-4]